MNNTDKAVNIMHHIAATIGEMVLAPNNMVDLADDIISNVEAMFDLTGSLEDLYDVITTMMSDSYYDGVRTRIIHTMVRLDDAL